MNLILKRCQAREDGIFSDLFDSDGVLIAQTLEHSYGPEWHAKIPSGAYNCRRGIHRLHDGIPFETFEVTGVPGCAGILFHKGNFNRDSEGCILIGAHITLSADGTQMVTESAKAFAKFLAIQEGADEFTLTVVASGQII